MHNLYIILYEFDMKEMQDFFRAYLYFRKKYLIAAYIAFCIGLKGWLLRAGIFHLLLLEDNAKISVI